MYKYRDTQPISEDPITETGSIVTIDNNDDVLALHSLVADIEPIQSLNGYDKPWSGGAGANKWDEEWETGIINGITGEPTPNANRIRSKNFIKVLPSTTYYGYFGSATVGISAHFYTDSYEYLASESSVNIKNRTFTTPSNAGYMKFNTASADLSTYNHDIAINYPSTVTTYSPYSNICPISGHDEVNVSVCGVNVWDEEWELGVFDNATGQKINNNSNSRSKNYISVKPSTQYYFKSVSNSRFFFYKADKTYISTQVQVANTVITTPSEAHYMMFQFGGATYNQDISINYPSTDHDYHAYNGNTYTTDLSGTRYGGTIDVASGVLTVTHVAVDMGSLTWEVWPGYTSIFRCGLPSDCKTVGNQGVPNWLCSAYEVTSGVSVSSTVGTIGQLHASYVLVNNSSYTDASAFTTAMTGQTLVYELATPTAVQLTAQEVELLVGSNNIWANSGDVSVTYAVDLDRYVIKPAEAVSINGKYLEDIVKGYRTLYVKGRESLAVDLDTYSVGTSNGEKIKGSKYPARTLTIGFQLLCDTNEEFRQRFNQLNNILSIGEADFVFNDEKDKFFTGFPIMDAEVETGRNNVTGEWTLYCAYPFKRSVQPITLTSTDAVIEGNTATFTFDYDGVMPAKPVLRAEFASAKVGGDYSEDGDCGYVAFLNQDESIIQLGNPDVMDVDADNKNDTLINTAFDVLTNWTVSGITLADITDPYWNKGAGQTMKFARGIGTLTRSIANTINFEFDIVQRLCVSSPTQAGTFKALLKNGNRIIVGYIIEKTGSGTTANVKYILNDIVVGADTIDVSYYNTNFGYCNRTPVYVTQDTYTLVREFKYDFKRHRTIGVFRPVKTGTRQVQDGWNYTQSNLNSGISRSGSVVTFSVGNLPDRTFKSSDIEATPCSNVTFETTGTFNTNAIRSACLVKKAGVPFADIPNVFTAGDIVEADCNSADVFLYRAGSVDGHLEPQYGALGNDWETFEIKVGQNIIRAVWSEWVNTNYKPVVKIIFNKVYI